MLTETIHQCTLVGRTFGKCLDPECGNLWNLQTTALPVPPPPLEDKLESTVHNAESMVSTPQICWGCDFWTVASRTTICSDSHKPRGLQYFLVAAGNELRQLDDKIYKH